MYNSKDIYYLFCSFSFKKHIPAWLANQTVAHSPWLTLMHYMAPILVLTSLLTCHLSIIFLVRIVLVYGLFIVSL